MICLVMMHNCVLLSQNINQSIFLWILPLPRLKPLLGQGKHTHKHAHPSTQPCTIDYFLCQNVSVAEGERGFSVKQILRNLQC